MLQPALLLNATYEPLGVISWKRAFTLTFLGKAEIIETQQGRVRSTNESHLLPAVLRLLRRVKVPRFSVTFNRQNVFHRDEYTCQYCLSSLPAAQLTFDHLLPKSRGGETSWTNIVTSCGPCNRQKGNKTPKEAGLTLHKKPKAPTWLPYVARNDLDQKPAIWSDYLW